jgi:uncharacterized protein YgiM (DUF1202 family)
MKRFSFLTCFILLILASYATPAFADDLQREACLVAPPPRLSVDGEAVVAAMQLNMRALPSAETGITVKLHVGTRLKVIAGPSCNSLYTWWRVETPNGLRGWVAEGTWEEYYIVPAEDAEEPPTPFEAACLLRYDPIYCL